MQIVQPDIVVSLENHFRDAQVTEDFAMENPVAAWHAEHVYFDRLLDLLEHEVAVFRTGERPNYELMLQIIHYLHHFADRYHHAREDVAFACLAKRTQGMELELVRLHQEHGVIAQAGADLLKCLEAILDGAVVPRADLEAMSDTYLLYYRNHIATEEREVLPRAARALTPQDWEAVLAAAPNTIDPLFSERPEERYRALRLRLDLRQERFSDAI
jgi:hemerythrin-like domain-containing protein